MSMHEHAGHSGPSAAPGQHSEGQPRAGFWASKTAVVAIAFLSIATFFLVSEHWAHALGYLPYLIILACPLLHLFHGGHGGHAGHGGPSSAAKPPGEGADQ